MRPMVTYDTSTANLNADRLDGFFVGWPSPPSGEALLGVLHGSSHVVIAWHDDDVVGFVNAISDGLLAAFIPLLEVRPGYQGRGVGSELVRRMLEILGHVYSIDVVCDPEVAPFYERLGLKRLVGMSRRNVAVPVLAGGA